MSILTRKIKIFPVGDKEEINRVYKWLRDGIYNQNKAMNQYMTALYVSRIQEASKEDRHELNLLYGRISKKEKSDSAYSIEDIQFPTGSKIESTIGPAVRRKFEKSVKDGLLYGKVSLPNFHMNNPLLVRGDFVRLRSTNTKNNGLYHNYKDHNEFLEHLYKSDLEIYIKFCNDITFKLILGNPYKSATLRSELQMIFEEYYKVCGSSIQIDDKDIILNLSMEVPEKEIELDENTVVGVDLGMAIPAVCSLNNNDYVKKSIGSYKDFTRVRTKIQAQKRQLQRNVKMCKGGHGRNRKLKTLNKFEDYERNWVKTYNHMVSKNIVEFAIKNKAKYINFESLKGYDTSKFILRNWSYYELQTQTAYKAKLYGIEVRHINPCYTSQVCSCCGHWEEGQRIDQEHFVCKACGAELNADLNGSRNIAKSKLFFDDEVKEKQKQEAREYYGIPEPEPKGSEEDTKKKKKTTRKKKKVEVA